MAFPETAATLSYYDDSVNGPEALVVLVPVGAILVPAHPDFHRPSTLALAENAGVRTYHLGRLEDLQTFSLPLG